MIQIGKYNTLTVVRRTDNGLYLCSPQDPSREVLLPNRYVPEEGADEGDSIEVFVYTDSEDRPVATTERPYATVGEFAFLEVTAVNSRVGAFLDWGLPKDLLVPFSEQKVKMASGGIYPVYVFLDHATGRVAASARLERYLGNVIPDYSPGQAVTCLVLKHVPERGYSVVVDNMHRGMLYDSELFEPVEVGQEVRAYVRNVRPDGKIDLTLTDSARRRVDSLEGNIVSALKRAGGVLAMSDRSSPEQIREQFGCSKKDFKKALGGLYRRKIIVLGEDEILLTPYPDKGDSAVESEK